MNYQKKISLLLSFTLVFGGCNNQQNPIDAVIQNYPNHHYISHANTYQNGSIETVYEDSTNAAYFLDYETMQLVPLCNKPNCTHKGSECLAHQCVSNSIMPVVYQDDLYWFHTTSQIVDAEDGQSTDYVFHTTLYRAALSDGEVEAFAEISGLSMKDAIEMVISDGVLYVIGCDQAFQDENGTWTEVSNCGDQYLYAIDLDTAEVKNYGLINDAPTAYYNWTTAGGGMYFEVRLQGIYQNKLYMSYRYVDDRTELTDYFDSIDYDDPNWSWTSAETEINWHRVNKCLNLETGKMENSDLPCAILIENDHYIYMENGKYFVLCENGESLQSPGMEWDDFVGITFQGGKLWKGSQDICFDPEKNADIPFAEQYQGKKLIVLDYVQGKYIIRYVNDDGETIFEAVAEEELLAH